MLLRDILWTFSKILFKSLFQYMTFPNLRTEYKWEESVHIRSSSWSRFSRIQPKYGKHVPKTSELGTFQAVVYAGEKVDKAVTPFSVSNNFLGKLKLSSLLFQKPALHKKWSFPSRYSSVNVTKFAVS